MFYKLAIELGQANNIINLHKDNIINLDNLLHQVNDNPDVYQYFQNKYKNSYSYEPDYNKFFTAVTKTDSKDLKNLVIDIDHLETMFDPYNEADKLVRNKIIYDPKEINDLKGYDDILFNSKFNRIIGLKKAVTENLPKYQEFKNLLKDFRKNPLTDIEREWWHKFSLLHEILEKTEANKAKLSPGIATHLGSNVLLQDFNILQTMPKEADRVKRFYLLIRELLGEYSHLSDNTFKYFIDRGTRLSKAEKKFLAQKYNNKIFQLDNYIIPATKAVHNANMLVNNAIYSEPVGSLLDHMAAKLIVENPQKFNYRNLPFKTKVQIKKLYQNLKNVTKWI